jgi:hypothetical protein
MRTLVTVVVAFLVLSAAELHDGLSADSVPRRQSGAVAPDQAAQPHDIDSLVAPIALYPDQLLAQILVCAGDPASVTKLNGWLKANQKLTGSELQDAAVLAGFEPSFVALTLFPTVIGSMAAKLEWTTLVGQVFIVDRSVVFASIQKLRAQARDVGTLKSSPQQDVEVKTTSSGEQVIVIEPANPQVIYVPQYNPTVVYTQAPTTTTAVVVENTSSADAAAAGLIGFTAGIAIGAAVNNNYYYGPHGWYGGGYMYNDAWDDYYDAREDARDDWQDHREDLADERGDRAGKSQEQRTERQQNRTENRPESQAQREQRRTEAQGQRDPSRAAGQTSATQSRGAGTAEARGYSQGNTKAAAERSGTRSDAFSGYSSGRSERAASSRGNQSRSSSRSRGGGGRRR